MNRNVLVLEDRFALRNSLVNLGDRAYHVGLHELIGGHLTDTITMGPVKALPYLTAGKTRTITGAADAGRLFETWFGEVIVTCPQERQHILC